VNFTTIVVQASIAKRLTLSDLLSPKVGQRLPETFLESPVDVTLVMNTDPKSQKRGGFKLTSFGRSSKPLLGSAGNLDICAKRTYYEKKVNGITHVSVFYIKLYNL
jgi:hypothetical protein